jgi:hypothetical protein
MDMKKIVYRFVFLFSFLSIVLNGIAVTPNKLKYKWANELELLKRVDLLPAYRTGQLVEQLSSYDRTGGNDDGFSGKYSSLREENGQLVLADLKGPGVIQRIWTPTPTNDTLSFFFDGEKMPRLVISFIDLFSGKVFPFVKPVCGNEVGGYYCYIPIPYSQSCKVVFSGKKIMFHQIQYRNLPGVDVESYSGHFNQNDKKLLAEVCGLWSGISPVITDFKCGRSSEVLTSKKSYTINPGEEITFFDSQLPGRIVGFEVDGGNSFEGLYKDVILSAKWDGEVVEAIYSPLADFFGYAYGKGAMRSMLIGKNGDKNYCYLPMPYDRSARMKLIYKKRDGVKQNQLAVTITVYCNQNQRVAQDEGKFYATWRRQINAPKGEFYTFLKTEGKGHYIGTVHLAQGLRPGMTLFFEGDDSTAVDGSMKLHGTGSEDYYNGGWYALLDRWDRGVSLSLHGSLDYSLPMNRTGAYRFYLTDKLSFEKEIFHGIEHGPERNEFPVDYTSVAYFYSDAPLKERMDPTPELRTVYLPREHIYFPQLMDVTLGGNVQVNQDRGLRIYTENEGMIRIMLNDVPEGKYQVLLSYFDKPEGADFCIWQRQKQLTDWKSTKSSNENLKERVTIGEIELTKQTNSISVHVRKSDKGNQFELDRIILIGADE